MSSVPTTMRAWQFTSTTGGMEKNLKINNSAPLPRKKPDQHLVQVLAVSLNPVDYKLAEMPLVARFFLAKPATPGLDFAGRIVEPAAGSSLEPGQLVFGDTGTNVIAGGALAEYAIATQARVAPLPEGISLAHGATAGVAGLSAYQSIIPYVKDGSNIFINGGSGGTGCFGIQIAKAKGCYVTTACSTANVELCKSLGADEVIDYKIQSVVETLVSNGRKYDHVVDNVGNDPALFWKSHNYTTPRAVFVSVGASSSFSGLLDLANRTLLPRFLGGARRKHVAYFLEPRVEELACLGQYMSNGQVKAVIDSQLPFEDAPGAYRNLKSNRTKGKIVVEVAAQ